MGYCGVAFCFALIYFCFYLNLLILFLIKTGTQTDFLYFGIESDCCSFVFGYLSQSLIFVFNFFFLFSCFGELIGGIETILFDVFFRFYFIFGCFWFALIFLPTLELFFNSFIFI